MVKRYRSIDLFAGIGGIRLGFEKAFGERISTEFVSEWDRYAQETYVANFGSNPPVMGDITKIDEKDIPPFDICLAGFPCQAFSIAGRKMGFDDDYKGMCRGTLFFDVARICDYHQPKVIFCENVKGLAIHDNGNTMGVIKKTLDKIGYSVVDEILNSKDFGVPQNRERIYIVAFRKDIDPTGFRFPEPTDSTKRISDIKEITVPSTKYFLSERYLETLREHRRRHESKGNGFGYVIRNDDEIASAIVCGGMGRERNLIYDHRITDFTPVTNITGRVNREGVRRMTPREWARLQGFPESFKLPLADTHLYKQLGNSVSVPVIEAIALEIFKTLNLNVKSAGMGETTSKIAERLVFEANL
ncbi:MAG: DNA (cytosine-5-)-methyltransferase [Thermoplasmatales archaeon]|nr:DNA (cytosine-5-)-methyltransferase [Thermoplasmatales archaeon]